MSGRKANMTSDSFQEAINDTIMADSKVAKDSKTFPIFEPVACEIKQHNIHYMA